MASCKFVLCVALLAISSELVRSSPAQHARKPTSMDGMVKEMRSLCNEENDNLSCMKFKVMNFIDTIMKQDSFKITDDIEVRSNSFAPINEQRSEQGVLEKVENYVQSHDVTMNLPIAGAKITLSPRKLDEDELNFKIQFSNSARSVGEARKSKLKKVIIPIMVFVLLKVMTLVPLVLGMLGLKAWNALQLSFFSFIISFGLAIFQLCKKLASDNHHPQISAHGPWDHAARSFLENSYSETTNEQQGDNLAYNAYA